MDARKIPGLHLYSSQEPYGRGQETHFTDGPTEAQGGDLTEEDHRGAMFVAASLGL